MSPADGHRHWHRRGYLPHFDGGAVVQAITFRLADSLPAGIPPARAGTPEEAIARFRQIEHQMDRGSGGCALRDPDCARIVANALRFFDGQRYRLPAWVVMPNHVHVIVEQVSDHRLGDILHSWKSFTANKIKRLRGQQGAFWAADYYDRYIRNAAHFNNAIAYVRDNPVKAGLVARAEDWPWMGPK